VAQGLRSRRERQGLAARRPFAHGLATACLLAVLAGCGQPPGDAPTPTAAPAQARAVDVAEIAAADLPAAILAECHGPLMDRMRRVKVRLTLADGRQLLVQAHLPDRARVREGTRDWLVRDDVVRRMDGAAVDEPEALLLRDALQVVDAAAFGALHRSSGCEAVDDGFRLRDGDGATATMTLFAGTLLPRAFTKARTTVAIEDYLHTRVSWVARTLRHARLGLCRVVFEDGGVQFPPDYFELPDAQRANGDTTQPNTIRTPIPGAVVETQSATPIVVAGKATRLVVLPDPGDWQARHETYRPVIEELQLQQQRIAGFPCIFVDERSRGLLAAPFRRRDDGPEFDAPDGYWLSDVPQGRLLVVYPPEGDVEQRIATGRQQLERALANRKLTAKGPILAQPFVHLHEGPPDANRLRSAAVRVWVRIE
jgi:hypothetical protein